QKPGEVFLSIAKEGSTVSGLLGTIAILISMALQSGVPLSILVRKFKDMSFSPSGFTNNPVVPTAKSITDYIFRYLGMKFLSPTDKEEIFGLSHNEGDGNGKTEGSSALKTDSVIAGLASLPLTMSSSPTETNPSVARATNADSPVCQCGTLMFRAGACYTCPNCGSTTGVCN
ncbi:MAG: vitamin B12-dependent ribonucleotide reductase, partial [Candidatus Yanofskybacteria bacterium]|nr:vitamin B12-dependent ribonucleotide reductase [Candidatus Yanofskybacteria bacterium]